MDRNYRSRAPGQGSRNDQGPRALGPVLCNEGSHRNEKHVPRKSSPRSPQLGQSPAQQRRPSTAEINEVIKKKKDP